MRENFFNVTSAPVIDKVLGFQCTPYGYQYREISELAIELLQFSV